MVVVHHDLARDRGVALAEQRVEAVFPVSVAERLRAARQEELAWHEEVVRDRVRREVAEIAEGDGAQAIVVGALQDLLAHVPEVTVAAGRNVLLRERDVQRQRAVQETLRVCPQQRGYDIRQEVQGIQEAVPQERVGRRPERPHGVR